MNPGQVFYIRNSDLNFFKTVLMYLFYNSSVTSSYWVFQFWGSILCTVFADCESLRSDSGTIKVNLILLFLFLNRRIRKITKKKKNRLFSAGRKSSFLDKSHIGGDVFNCLLHAEHIIRYYNLLLL